MKGTIYQANQGHCGNSKAQASALLDLSFVLMATKWLFHFCIGCLNSRQKKKCLSEAISF